MIQSNVLKLEATGGINTRSGTVVNVLAPNPKDLRLDDIIWSLSRQPRYLAHTAESEEGHAYSTGQHSVLIAEAVLRDTGNPLLALAALLHDATEAYLGDIVRPFKPLMVEYAHLEEAMELAICEAFNISPALIRQMKPWDTRICADEMKALLPLAPQPSAKPLGIEISIWTPRQTRLAMAQLYEELTALVAKLPTAA